MSFIKRKRSKKGTRVRATATEDVAPVGGDDGASMSVDAPKSVPVSASELKKKKKKKKTSTPKVVCTCKADRVLTTYCRALASVSIRRSRRLRSRKSHWVGLCTYDAK